MKASSTPRALIALILAAGISGCATLSTDPGQPSYASDAETNLVRGNEAYDSRNYLEAERYFQYVRTKYPFLDAAREAELRLADTHFAREQYIEARDAYQTFVKLHPSWPKIDYAAFQAAHTHYKEIPSDFFLLPSSTEKDQTEVKSALRAMTDFLRIYPKSEYAAKAQEIVNDTRRRLATHEMYVADFYATRERWKAVVARLETVVTQYPGLGYDEKAWFGIHDAWLRLNEPEKAKKTLEDIISKLPGTPAAERAKRLLGGT